MCWHERGRIHLSAVERGLKSPPLSKLAELCEVMQVHPVTLLTLAYTDDQAYQLLAQVRQELDAIRQSHEAS